MMPYLMTDVDQHQPRLVERADQIFSRPVIHAGLAADAGIDLGEQRRGDLHAGNAAEIAGGGKAGDVADDPAAQRDERRAALEPLRDEPVVDGRNRVEIFVLLARRQEHDGDFEPRGAERGFHRRQIERGHVAVGDDRGLFFQSGPAHQGAGLGEVVLAHVDRVRAVAEVDGERIHGPAQD